MIKFQKKEIISEMHAQKKIDYDEIQKKHKLKLI